MSEEFQRWTIHITFWALAIKASLGDVWHINNDGRAWCDKRIRLDVGGPNAGKRLADDAYQCKRCLALSEGK